MFWLMTLINKFILQYSSFFEAFETLKLFMQLAEVKAIE